MIWVPALVLIIGFATEVLWVLAVDAVDRNYTWTVVAIAVALPGINSVTVTEYVADPDMIWPMLIGHATGALAAMRLKGWLASRRGRPTTGPGHQSSSPS